MAEKACVKRLQKEYRALCKEPVSNIVARPSPNDILEWQLWALQPSVMLLWALAQVFNAVTGDQLRNIEVARMPKYYVLEGSKGTPFAGGYYYGKIKFPPEYPYKPPGITMITPNGRFMPQKKICLSMSDFHPESWNPMWSVSSILTGLLSFMMDNSPTTGSVNTTAEEKQRLAKASLAFSCKNITFKKIFPEYVEKFNEQQFSEQNNSEAGPPAQANNTNARADKDSKNARANLNRVDGAVKEKRGNRKQSIPTWMMILLVSIFGMVMALPLLQL